MEGPDSCCPGKPGSPRIALESHKAACLVLMCPESRVCRARRVTGSRCALRPQGERWGMSFREEWDISCATASASGAGSVSISNRAAARLGTMGLGTTLFDCKKSAPRTSTLESRAVIWRGRSLASIQLSWDNESKRLAMQITLELPEDIARGLESRWKDLPRAALESLALEAHRSRTLTAAQLRRLLGFATRMQVDAFLKEHEVFDFTAADFEQDRETLRQLRERGPALSQRST
jgi:hypothetical protein